MTSRLVLVLLSPPTWCPPGIDPGAWRHALAEDTVDVLETLAETEVAIAVAESDRALADSVRWPSMKVYPASTPSTALRAAFEAGYDHAAVIAPDAPDLPAMLLGKLLRPLGSRPLAVAPATDGGLWGIAAQLPYSGELDFSGICPEAVQVPGWHRLDSPAGFARLDPALEGWEATRALLSA